MNQHTPPPKLENIEKAIKFTVSGPDRFDKCRLVASLNVGSACWFSDYEAKRHPDMMICLKEKLNLHLLRQLYHDQRREIGDAVDAFLRGWTPGPGVTLHESMQARDRLMKLANYTPPAGFEDDQFCREDVVCPCRQFEFMLGGGGKD